MFTEHNLLLWFKHWGSNAEGVRHGSLLLEPGGNKTSGEVERHTALWPRVLGSCSPWHHRGFWKWCGSRWSLRLSSGVQVHPAEGPTCAKRRAKREGGGGAGKTKWAHLAWACVAWIGRHVSWTRSTAGGPYKCLNVSSFPSHKENAKPLEGLGQEFVIMFAPWRDPPGCNDGEG